MSKGGYVPSERQKAGETYMIVKYHSPCCLESTVMKYDTISYNYDVYACLLTYTLNNKIDISILMFEFHDLSQNIQ